MIRVIYLTDGASMELICIPLELFPLWDDLVNLSSRVGFLELTRIGSSLRGMPVMRFMIFPMIAIGWSSQIFPSWYLLTRNLVASSLRVPKFSMMGALR